MAPPEVTIIRPAACRSREVGQRLAELDDQLALLLEALADATPEELAWQSAPGMNTIGMLLTHLAIVDVYWGQIGMLGTPADIPAVLEIGMNDDGIPFAPDGSAPEWLAGRDLAHYRALLARARTWLTDLLRDRDDAWLDQERTRVRMSGAHHRFDHRWVLYHLLEHFAAHAGQILLIRHAWRDHVRARGGGARAATP